MIALIFNVTSLRIYALFFLFFLYDLGKNGDIELSKLIILVRAAWYIIYFLLSGMIRIFIYLFIF